MKNLSKNIAVFIALSIALSSFIACTNTASSSKNGATANANSASVKNNDFLPAPSGILKGVIKDVDGNTFKLEDKKGKVLLVNLWATWCQPCRAEMPEFVALQDKYKDRDFEIIGLVIIVQTGKIHNQRWRYRRVELLFYAMHRLTWNWEPGYR